VRNSDDNCVRDRDDNGACNCKSKSKSKSNYVRNDSVVKNYSNAPFAVSASLRPRVRFRSSANASPGGDGLSARTPDIALNFRFY
jgi:hypothetical protein